MNINRPARSIRPAFDKGADLGVNQGAQPFQGVEYEAVTMGFVAVKETDG